jgi:hypothetical protein
MIAALASSVKHVLRPARRTEVDYVTFMHKVLTIAVIMDELKSRPSFFLRVIKVSSYHDDQQNRDQRVTGCSENMAHTVPLTIHPIL